MSLADELQKLEELRHSGALTNEEFATAKARLLDGATPRPAGWAGPGSPGAYPGPPPSDSPAAGPGWPNQQAVGDFDPAVQSAEVEQQTRQWGLLLHLSQFAGFVVPFGGLIVPIVIWQLKKNELPGIDIHGKNAVNWIISAIIYAIVSAVLIVVLIGIPLLLILVVLHVVFPIVAAIKANSGEYWKYPMAITFLS